jgi:hypothetical protein
MKSLLTLSIIHLLNLLTRLVSINQSHNHIKFNVPLLQNQLIIISIDFICISVCFPFAPFKGAISSFLNIFQISISHCPCTA